MNATKSTTKPVKLLDRVESAVAAGEGFTFTPDELRAWCRVLVEGHARVEVTMAQAHTIGQALQKAGWQIHVNPSDGLVDGIEPMLPGADSGTVN